MIRFKPISLKRIEGKFVVKMEGRPYLLASTVKDAMMVVKYFDMVRKIEVCGHV